MVRGGTTSYYHADGLGSIVGLTDPTGTLVEKYRYSVFGAVQITDGGSTVRSASAFGNRVLFTGRELDPETGLYYFRARAYDPRLGRFLQRDPVGYAAGINLYSYVGNNPLIWRDPLGLWWDWGAAGQGLVDTAAGVAVGATIVGASVLLLPAAAASAVVAGLGILGAAGLGVATGAAITGYGLDGKKLSGADRTRATVGSIIGWASLTGGAIGRASRNVQETTTLYRGVKNTHPGFQEAVQGVARPRQPLTGHADPTRHNLGDTRSKFVSFTTDRNVARQFAGKEGVVLEARVPRSRTVASPDFFNENEVLVLGDVSGAKVTNP